MARTRKKKAKRRKARHNPALSVEPEKMQIAKGNSVFVQNGLLESYRTRWQHADWMSLLAVEIDDIRTDPDRGKLAALLGSVHSAFGDPATAEELFMLAADWGCDRRVAAQLMISAIQNTIGRANTAIGDLDRAELAFNEAVALIEPRADVALLGQVRRIRETVNMGLQDQARQLVDAQILSLRKAPEVQARSLTEIAETLVLPEWHSQVIKTQSLPNVAINYTPTMSKVHPRTVVVGTSPRTGSTWVYNAVRFLLEATGAGVYASWCEHYRGPIKGDTRTHVVKVHEPDHLTFPYDILITTHRDLAERLGSLIRMGWLAKAESAVVNARKRALKLDDFWATRSNLVVSYENIEHQPECVILEIAHALRIPADLSIVQQVNSKILAMSQPEYGQKYDPLTLLHPGHKSDGTETAELAGWVRAVLDKTGNEGG